MLSSRYIYEVFDEFDQYLNQSECEFKNICEKLRESEEKLHDDIEVFS